MMTSSSAPQAQALRPQQVAEYESSGYLIVRGLFAAETIAAVAADADSLLERCDLIEQNNLRCRWQPHCVTGAPLFETFDPVVDIAPAIAGVAADPRLLAVLAALYGAPACLFKDKLIYKPPGANGYALHQDYIAWPGFPRSFVTALIAVDAANASNGCTEVFTGCHREGYLSPADGNHHAIPDGLLDESACVPLELLPGDVAIFGCFTPHRSAPNRSDGWRRHLYLSFNAVSDGGPQREVHYLEFHAWLRERYARNGRRDVFFR
jgi:ectoine hydroxylase-related dioxygenase (phytanoyl-CoA dioxygenase family)